MAIPQATNMMAAVQTQPATQAQAGNPAANNQTPAVPGQKKPFDFQLYMTAVQTGANKFFTQQIPYFFKNIGPVMKKAPDWWKKQKQDEQIAYVGWVLGHVLGLVGIILMIVL